MSAYPHIGGPGDAWTYDPAIDPQNHVERYCDCGEEIDDPDDDYCAACKPTRCSWCDATPPASALRSRGTDRLCVDCAAEHDATCDRCGVMQDSPDDLTNNICRECAAKGA